MCATRLRSATRIGWRALQQQHRGTLLPLTSVPLHRWRHSVPHGRSFMASAASYRSPDVSLVVQTNAIALKLEAAGKVAEAQDSFLACARQLKSRTALQKLWTLWHTSPIPLSQAGFELWLEQRNLEPIAMPCQAALDFMRSSDSLGSDSQRIRPTDRVCYFLAQTCARYALENNTLEFLDFIAKNAEFTQRNQAGKEEKREKESGREDEAAAGQATTGDKEPSVVPYPFTWSSILSQFIEGRDMKGALLCVAEMTAADIEIDDEMYLKLATGFACVGNLSACADTLRRISYLSPLSEADAGDGSAEDASVTLARQRLVSALSSIAPLLSESEEVYRLYTYVQHVLAAGQLSLSIEKVLLRDNLSRYLDAVGETDQASPKAARESPVPLTPGAFTDLVVGMMRHAKDYYTQRACTNLVRKWKTVLMSPPPDGAPAAAAAAAAVAPADDGATCPENGDSVQQSSMTLPELHSLLTRLAGVLQEAQSSSTGLVGNMASAFEEVEQKRAQIRAQKRARASRQAPFASSDEKNAQATAGGADNAADERDEEEEDQDSLARTWVPLSDYLDARATDNRHTFLQKESEHTLLIEPSSVVLHTMVSLLTCWLRLQWTPERRAAAAASSATNQSAEKGEAELVDECLDLILELTLKTESRKRREKQRRVWFGRLLLLHDWAARKKDEPEAIRLRNVIAWFKEQPTLAAHDAGRADSRTERERELGTNLLMEPTPKDVLRLRACAGLAPTSKTFELLLLVRDDITVAQVLTLNRGLQSHVPQPSDRLIGFVVQAAVHGMVKAATNRVEGALDKSKLSFQALVQLCAELESRGQLSGGRVVLALQTALSVHNSGTNVKNVPQGISFDLEKVHRECAATRKRLEEAEEEEARARQECPDRRTQRRRTEPMRVRRLKLIAQVKVYEERIKTLESRARAIIKEQKTVFPDNWAWLADPAFQLSLPSAPNTVDSKTDTSVVSDAELAAVSGFMFRAALATATVSDDMRSKMWNMLMELPPVDAVSLSAVFLAKRWHALPRSLHPKAWSTLIQPLIMAGDAGGPIAWFHACRVLLAACGHSSELWLEVDDLRENRLFRPMKELHWLLIRMEGKQTATSKSIPLLYEQHVAELKKISADAAPGLPVLPHLLHLQLETLGRDLQPMLLVGIRTLLRATAERLIKSCPHVKILTVIQLSQELKVSMSLLENNSAELADMGMPLFRGIVCLCLRLIKELRLLSKQDSGRIQVQVAFHLQNSLDRMPVLISHIGQSAEASTYSPKLSLVLSPLVAEIRTMPTKHIKQMTNSLMMTWAQLVNANIIRQPHLVLELISTLIPCGLNRVGLNRVLVNSKAAFIYALLLVQDFVNVTGRKKALQGPAKANNVGRGPKGKLQLLPALFIPLLTRIARRAGKGDPETDIGILRLVLRCMDRLNGPSESADSNSGDEIHRTVVDMLAAVVADLGQKGSPAAVNPYDQLLERTQLPPLITQVASSLFREESGRALVDRESVPQLVATDVFVLTQLETATLEFACVFKRSLWPSSEKHVSELLATVSSALPPCSLVPGIILDELSRRRKTSSRSFPLMTEGEEAELLRQLIALVPPKNLAFSLPCLIPAALQLAAASASKAPLEALRPASIMVLVEALQLATVGNSAQSDLPPVSFGKVWLLCAELQVLREKRADCTPAVQAWLSQLDK